MQQLNVGRQGFRNGYYGNPFRVGPGEDTTSAVRRFALYAVEKFSDADLELLKGKQLFCPGCTSKQIKPCHADVLAWLAGHDRSEWFKLIDRAK